MLSDDLVRDSAARERDFRHAATRRLDGLAHRLTHFVRLAGRDADLALAVAHCDERVEAEAPAAFHHLGHAVDRDDVLDHAVAVAPALTAVAVPALATASPASAATTATLAARTARRAVLSRGGRWRRRHFGHRHVRRRGRPLGRRRCFVFWISH